MKNIIIITAVLMLAFLINTCKKDKDSVKIDRAGIWACNDSQHFDSIKLANQLTGSWKWVAQFNPWTNTTSKADKDVVVNFTSSGTYTETENSIIVASGNWKLMKTVDIIELDLDHSGNYLGGAILMCHDHVLFNLSYVDGYDNLFERL